MHGIICKWCTKEIPEGAITCPHGGKLRKDIYRDELLTYTFSGLLLIPIILFFAGYEHGRLIIREVPIYAKPWYKFVKIVGVGHYQFSFINFISSPSGLLITFLFIIFLVGALYYYVRVSKKIGSWIWI